MTQTKGIFDMTRKNRIARIVLPLMCCALFSCIAHAEETAYTVSDVYLTSDMTYASYSKIHSDPAKLYKNTAANANGITVCVNAGHGTQGGESQRTQCHPDGTPKVTGGSAGAGATTATSISSGMTFNDGTPEAAVTLNAALALKNTLLKNGYNILMIRENNNTQLDNIARTILANKYADCHISLHWDSTSSNKGAFYCKVPSNAAYKAMVPVSSTWQKSDSLGEALITGLKGRNIKIFSSGYMELDLTQTSYSSVASVDIELGDAASDHSDAALQNIALGLTDGVNSYFKSKTPVVKEPVVYTADDMVHVAIGKKAIVVNGQAFETDAAAYIQKSSNSTLVPFRFVAIALSGQNIADADISSIITWDSATRTAVIKAEGKTVSFKADSSVMTINGEKRNIPNGAKAEVKNGRLYVPFRALGEALGKAVEWDKKTETASYKIK